jgi:hypothetical protein
LNAAKKNSNLWILQWCFKYYHNSMYNDKPSTPGTSLERSIRREVKVLICVGSMGMHGAIFRLLWDSFSGSHYLRCSMSAPREVNAAFASAHAAERASVVGYIARCVRRSIVCNIDYIPQCNRAGCSSDLRSPGEQFALIISESAAR